MIGESRGRDTRKDRRRRGLLVLLLLLLAFALGGLSVALLRGEPKPCPQGTQSAPPSSVPVPSASGSEVVGGVEATPSAVPTVLGSGDDEAETGGVSFSITGGADNLRPGVSTPIRLTITNPNGVPIYVTTLTVKIAADSTPAGCASASNVRLTQSNASTANPITIPARGSVTLTVAPRAPQITLLNLPGVNQDACKNKSFGLTYSGSAHS